MRRTVSLALPIAATALLGILTACATADDGVLAQEQDQTTGEQIKIPTPDAGSTSSSSSSSTGGSSSSSSTSSTSSTSSSSGGTDAGTSSGTTTSSSGGTAGQCDVSDPIKVAVWLFELSEQTTPVPCPCASGQCCYLSTTCVTDF